VFDQVQQEKEDEAVDKLLAVKTGPFGFMKATVAVARA
jgi:hypothetical protein